MHVVKPFLNKNVCGVFLFHCVTFYMSSVNHFHFRRLLILYNLSKMEGGGHLGRHLG